MGPVHDFVLGPGPLRNLFVVAPVTAIVQLAHEPEPEPEPVLDSSYTVAVSVHFQCTVPFLPLFIPKLNLEIFRGLYMFFFWLLRGTTCEFRGQEIGDSVSSIIAPSKFLIFEGLRYLS